MGCLRHESGFGVKGMSLDLYYVALDRKDASFAQGVGRGAAAYGWSAPVRKENPDSTGTRPATSIVAAGRTTISVLTGTWKALPVRLVRRRQDPRMDDLLRLGYTLAEVRFSPRLGLKADALSGDRNLQDNRLGTFNLSTRHCSTTPRSGYSHQPTS